MGTKRQAVWVGVVALIVTIFIAAVSFILGSMQNLTAQQEKMLVLEDMVNKSLFENLKQGITPTRSQIFMTMRSEARKQGVGRIDSTSLDRVVENVTAHVFQDAALAQEQKKALLEQAVSLSATAPMSFGHDSTTLNTNRGAIWRAVVLVILVISLPFAMALLFYYSGPNRMTQSSLGTFVETLIKYLFSRYENDLAMTLVEENLVLSPRNPNLYASKSHLLLRLGRTEEALRAIDQGLDICGTSARPALLRDRAVCLSRLGRHEEAIEELNRAKSGLWGFVRGFFERGDFLRNKIEVIVNNGSPDEAMSESNRLVARYPKSPLTFSMRANILRKSGYVEDSLLAAERAIELSRGTSDPGRDTRTAGLLSVAAAYAMMERFEESYEILTQHMPHTNSSFQTIENIYGFEKILKDNIYSKKIKDVFKNGKNSHVEVGERNYFL